MLGRRVVPLLALVALAALPRSTAFAPGVPEPPAVIGARSIAAVPTRVEPAPASAPSHPRKEALEQGEDEEERPQRWVDIDTGPPGTGHLGTSAAQTLPSPVGDDRIVNQGYFGLQSETAIAVNAAGTVLVAGFNDPAGFDLTPVQISGVARSIDGGQTWIASGPLPCPAGAQLIGDPDVKYDPVGDRFFYSSIYTDPATARQALCVHVSDAAGLAWGGPFLVPGASVAGTLADKEMIAVNVSTGRLIMVWIQVVTATFARNLMSSVSDDGGGTWSSPVTVASNTGIAAPQVRFVPGPNATASVYVAYAQGSSIRVARSLDGGASYGTPVVLRSSLPAVDEVVGFDRAHLMPSMDLDPETGKVYVVYPAPDATGTTDIELVSGSGTTFTAPIKIDSNPGGDRAQLRPAIAVDASTHRVHVTWYDQDGAGSGDLSELMHTASDDAGATWSPPTPILDRPFHAAYGDDGSEPNLGDYNECVAQSGVLHSVAGATRDKVFFDDAQPKPSMGAVDVWYDRLAEADGPVAALRLAGLALIDPCNGSNGRLDPGETASLTFTLENYVANPLCSPVTYTGVLATLSSPTPGVVVAVGEQAYAGIAPLAAASNAVPYRVSLDPGFVAGTDVDLLLTVHTDQGVVELRRRIPTGSPGAAVTLINESFDAVAPPALPAGWNTVYTQGTSNPWVTSTTLPGVGVGSQAAYHANSGVMGWNRLWSPAVIVPTPPAGTECTVTLDFDIAWSLENDPAKKVLAFDGCFLRIHDLTGGAYTVRSINAGAFADGFHVGAQEGYTHRFARATTFGTQDVWSGSSLGQKHVSMTFPGAGMAGHTIQLRFEFQENANGTCAGAGLAGPCGVSIDNLVLRYVPTISAPCSPVAVSAPGPESFGIRGLWPNPSANGALHVRFSLPTSAGARLELLDAAGRVIRGRDLEPLGVGTHTLALGEGAPIAPGVYFVRLRQGALHQTSKAIVLHGARGD